MMALKNACLQVAIGEKRNAISVASEFDLDHDGLILGAGERPVVGALPFALT